MAHVEFDALRPGDRIDEKYEVQQVLGKGGMGVVLAALHLDLQERVALKFLLPQAVGRHDSLERFLREARSMRKLKSEHVVKVLDVGRLSGSGLPYMAMEFLDGADLSKVIEWKGPLATEVACDFILQACDAIGEAHALGIIHRDIKPANLFALRTKGCERALIKILDFGIAKVIDAEGPGGTRTQAVMGSAFYMSPEQMRSTKKVDARTDIWALGITLYELLTARHPFQGVNVPEVVLSISNDPPIPPRIYLPDLPVGLEAIILRCLEKDPEARFRTAGDLAAALAPYAGHGATELATRVQSRGSFAEILPDERLPMAITAAHADAPTLSAPHGLVTAAPVIVMSEGLSTPRVSQQMLMETFQAPETDPALDLAPPVLAVSPPVLGMSPFMAGLNGVGDVHAPTTITSRKKKLSLGALGALALVGVTLMGATFGAGAYGASPSGAVAEVDTAQSLTVAAADRLDTRVSPEPSATDAPAAPAVSTTPDVVKSVERSATSSQGRPSTTKTTTNRTPSSKPSAKGRGGHGGAVD